MSGSGGSAERIACGALVLAFSLSLGGAPAGAQSLFQSLFGDPSRTDPSGGAQTMPAPPPGGNADPSAATAGVAPGDAAATPAGPFDPSVASFPDPSSEPGSPSLARPQSVWEAPPASGAAQPPTLWGGGGMTAAGRASQGGAAEEGWCNREVALADERTRAQAVEGRVALARQGHSLLPAGMLSLSCVDRILNTGFNIFQGFDVNQIMRNVLNAFSCERVLRMVNGYANQQIQQQVGQVSGGAWGAANQAFAATGIGQAVPGISLGTFTGSVNLNPVFVDIGGVGGGANRGGNFVNLGQAWGRGAPALPFGSPPPPRWGQAQGQAQGWGGGGFGGASSLLGAR